jgi:two-component system OmpR family sensor kinase
LIAWPRTLHARLTAGYAIAFFAGLLIFAGISYASLDAALKAVVDARLQGAETAAAGVLLRDPAVGHATRERLDLILGSNLSGAVLSGNERALYSSVVSLSRSTRAAILRAGADPGLTTLSIGGVGGRMVTQRLRAPGGALLYVGIWRQLDIVEDLERLAILIFGAAVAVIGVSAVLVGAVVARHGLQPLRAVANLASEIEAKDLSRRLGFEADDSELGRLTTTFDRMLARLEDAFERQRRFTADASHELRAPLSVIHVAADFALRREREPAAYRRALASILRAAQQLEELTDRLLTAARADAGHVSIERVELSALVSDAFEHMMPVIESRRVKIVTSLKRPAFVNCDRGGVVRAIAALVENAIRFSPEGGSVTASLEEERGRVRLTIQDEGPGFSAEALQHATERFWRGDPARAPGSGSGLGLAISDSIVRASGGSLTLQNGSGRGAMVVVELPAAS